METIQRDSVIGFPFLGITMNPPSYFELFGIRIYFYGVIIAAAFMICLLWAAKKSVKFGIKENDVYDYFIWIVPFSVIGSRLYYILFKLDYYIANPGEIINIREGGLAIYGGVIAGIIVILLVSRHKKIHPLAAIDLFITACILGQAIGRWGNFMNREAFGAETEIFCRMSLTDPTGKTIYIHPTFLYESLWNFAGFIFLNIFINKGKRRYNGQCLYIYCLWYGLGRFWIEGLRTDSLYIGSTGIRVSQLLSALMVVFGAVMLIINRKRNDFKKEEEVPPASENA